MRHLVRFPCPDGALNVRLATGRRELAGAFELVYRSYLARGYIRPNPGRIVYYPTFGLPTSRTVVSTDQTGGILGTVSLVGDNPLGLQLEATYPNEVRWLRDRGRKTGEVTCLAVKQQNSLRPRAVFFALTRFLIHYAFWRDYDDLLIAIHPRHARFYAQCLGAVPFGPCRPYAAACDHPALCCRIDLARLQSNVRPELWRQYFAEEVDITRCDAPPMRLDDHCYFCFRRGIVPALGLAGVPGRRKSAG